MIPYSTDAPLYHLPIATVGLIVLNILIFCAAPDYESQQEMILVDASGRVVSEAELEQYVAQEERGEPVDESFWDGLHAVPASSGGSLLLQYGVGLKPWQWFTSIFMHAGIFHLLGNMIFLWAFGIIVEGKVGLFPFLLIYLAIGCGQSAVEQLLMLGAAGGASLGASAAIFGLLGVAMMWAPRNDFECFWSFGFLEIPVLAFAGLKFLLEGIEVFFQGLAMSSSMLHLMGAGLGLALGGLWIKRDWVDCEGYDLFSVMAGTEGSRGREEELKNAASDLLDTAHHSKLAAQRPRPAVAQPATPAGPFPAAVPLAGGPALAMGVPGSTAGPVATLAAAAPQIDSLEDLFGSAASLLGLDSDEDPAEDDPAKDDSLQRRIARLDGAIEQGRFAEVPALLQGVRDLQSEYEISQAALMRWIQSMLAEKQYTRVVPLLNQHIRRFAHKRPAMQVQLAKILMHLKRSQQALQVLRRVDTCQLSPSAAATVEQLIRRCTAAAK